MAKDNTLGIYKTQSPHVITWLALIEPHAYMIDGKPKGDPKYQAMVVINPDAPDLPAMKKKAVEVARAKWPSRDLKDLQFPFRAGDKIIAKAAAKGEGKAENLKYLSGKVTLKAKSKDQPGLAGIEGAKIVDYDTMMLINSNKSKFYSGVEALLELNFSAYEGKDGDGVTCYLNMVVSTGKGAKIGGHKSAAQSFSGYVGSYSAEDPTGGAVLDDEIPF